MNVATCPKCGSHAVIVDKTDDAQWHDEDTTLYIDIPMTCVDCSAVLVLRAVATELKEVE